MMKLLALAILAFCGCAAAQSPVWPDKPVTLVVPYPAGAGVDPVARLVGKNLSELWCRRRQHKLSNRQFQLSPAPCQWYCE